MNFVSQYAGIRADHAYDASQADTSVILADERFFSSYESSPGVCPTVLSPRFFRDRKHRRLLDHEKDGYGKQRNNQKGLYEGKLFDGRRSGFRPGCPEAGRGVGKTTTLRSIMGLTRPRSGSIRFRDSEILGKPPDAISRLGLAFMSDDLRIFPDLTCEENLEIARRLSRHSGHWNRERVEALFPVLKARRKQKGLNLSGGEKKMLSLGRTLMANPVLILLDEPSEGLAPLIVQSLVNVIREIRQRDMTLLLADQNLKFCRQICDRGYIIEKGCIVHEGTMDAIWGNEEVIKKYLVL